LSILLYFLFANCYLLNIEINHGSNHPSISSSFLHLQQQIFFWKKESWMGRKRIMGLCSKLVDEELNIKWSMIYKLKKKKCSKFFFFFCYYSLFNKHKMGFIFFSWKFQRIDNFLFVF
jgi:hypothetical protein